jgi:hypothetical protein
MPSSASDCRGEVVGRVDAPGVAGAVVVRVRMRYMTGSRRFMLGEAMSILARSTCARRRGTRRRACARRGRGSPRPERRGRGWRPGSVRVPRCGDGPRRRGRTRRLAPYCWLDECDRPLVQLLEVVRGVVEPLVPVEAQPAHVLLDRARRTRPPPWSGWCRRSAGCTCRRSRGPCRSSGRSTWRGRCAGSRWARAGSA